MRSKQQLKSFNRERPQWTLTLPDNLYNRLIPHLFPGDKDEHGAIVLAGIQETDSGLHLLARDIVLARDGIDFVPGTAGYRMLTAEFVTQNIVRCRNEKLVYIAVHNHAGDDSVSFSSVDLSSQEKGYPALLDILDGTPVGALVFARNAVAGRLWITPSKIAELHSARVLGPSITHLFPSPQRKGLGRLHRYDRQSRMFGDRGQELLSGLTVGVIGAGGVGSLVVEYLARLGVGKFVIADPDRVEITNVPRVTGSTMLDAMPLLTSPTMPQWLRQIGLRLSSTKIKVMKRIIRRANPNAQVDGVVGDFVDDSVCRRFTRCDYLFNAADSYQARLLFNAMVHAYLIPGVDMGAKVPVEKSGDIGEVRAVVHPVSPSSGCLLCNGYIPASALQREMESPTEKKHQRYVDDTEVVAPSVITLNATAASRAVNDFLFSVTGLTHPHAEMGYVRFMPRSRRTVLETPRKDDDCPHCSTRKYSILALGDASTLPAKNFSGPMQQTPNR